MTDDHLHLKVEGLEEELARLRGEIGRLVEVVVDGAREADSETAGAGEASPLARGADEPGEASPDSHRERARARAHAAREELEREIETAVSAGKRALHELDEAAHRHPTGSLVVAFVVGVLIARALGPGRRE